MNEFLEFKKRRLSQNEKVNALENKNINRFYAIDSGVYREGALGVRTKEMLGLVASLVLRCEDCITYHLVRCVQEDCSDEEISEIFSVGLIVGGSITIPEIRRATEKLAKLREMKANDENIDELL